jgi:hypothetical protein
VTAAAAAPTPDKTDKMPPEEKPADKPVVANKPVVAADKPAAAPPADKPAAAAKPPTPPATTSSSTSVTATAAIKPATPKPATPPTAKPAQPAAAAQDDDFFGKLQGGSKPSTGGNSVPTAAGTSATAVGYAQISCNQAARVAIDGKDVGATPIGGHQLPLSPGKHKVTFSFDTQKLSFQIVIKAGEVTQMHKEF